MNITHTLAKKSFLISGTHSGVGKTTTSFVLMSLLKEKGYEIQPFKHGPDFIDPGYHRLATGNESINLDQWMMNHQHILDTFNLNTQMVDIGIVEGMGAIFDGQNGTSKGSGAELASILSIPVILVVDIYGMTSSVNALLQGFLDFDPHLKIEGIIFNRAGSQKHYNMIENALLPRFKELSLGFLPFSTSINIPERHLGLVTLEENDSIIEKCKPYLEIAKKTLKLEYLIDKFTLSGRDKSVSIVLQSKPKVRIGIAKDKAFCFYYRLNLLALEEAGAELIYFSPLENKCLPADIDGIYFGGGYPEMFGKQLSISPITKEVLNRARSGMPIYAECGGFIYLCNQLQYENDTSHSMVGVFPYTIKWDKNYLVIKYVEVQTMESTILGPKGLVIRGQEFHQTRLLNFNPNAQNNCYQITSSSDEKFYEGHLRYNVLGSYMHLYFPSDPMIAKNFVKTCKDYQKETHAISVL